MEKVYTVNEIAEMTRLSTRTIRRYLSSGQLQGQKIGRQWRFTQTDLASFLDSQALSDALNTKEQRLRQEFATGKLLVELDHSQADLTIIKAYPTRQALQQEKTTILTNFNTLPGPTNVHLSLRVLENQQLRISLFGELSQVLAFANTLN